MIPLFKSLCLLIAAPSAWVIMTSPNPPARDHEIVLREVKGVSTTGSNIMKLLPIASFLIEAFILIQSYSKHSIWNGFMPNDDVSMLEKVPPTFYLGLFCLVTAAYIRYQCYQVMGKHFTFEVTLLEDHHLITTGPYSIVRHPSYTGTVLYFCGLCILWASEGSWVRESKFLNTAAGQIILSSWILVYGTIVASLILRVGKEDELMKRKFGQQWVQWEKDVPWKLIPGIH